MSAQFTPGPWQWVNDEEIEQAEHPFTSIAETFPIFKDANREQQNANCRLIAAAPELYASLRGLLIAFQSDGPFPRESIERAEAAIAKARGDLAEVVGGQHDPL